MIEDNIMQIMSEYDLPSVRNISLLGDGLNTHYLISTVNENYAFRVYRAGWRTHDDIAYELAVLRHLRERGAGVCGPIARRDGSFISHPPSEPKPILAALFEYAEGETPDPGKPNVANICGRNLALIHQGSDGFSCQYQRFRLDLDHLLTRPLDIIIPMLERRPSDVSFLKRTADALQQGLSERLSGLDWGFCHGDFHGGNARIKSDGDLRAFDFDCGGLGWRAYDLSVCQLFCSEPDIWERFKRGYQEARPLPESELEAIPWFIVTRQIWRLGVFATHWPHLMGHSADDRFFDEHLGILRDRLRTYLPQLAI